MLLRFSLWTCLNPRSQRLSPRFFSFFSFEERALDKGEACERRVQCTWSLSSWGGQGQGPGTWRSQRREKGDWQGQRREKRPQKQPVSAGSLGEETHALTPAGRPTPQALSDRPPAPETAADHTGYPSLHPITLTPALFTCQSQGRDRLVLLTGSRSIRGSHNPFLRLICQSCSQNSRKHFTYLQMTHLNCPRPVNSPRALITRKVHLC